MILTSSIDYESVCIDSSTVRFLSGITLAVSTINIFIFLFDLYIKYEIMSYEASTRTDSNKVVEDDEEEEAKEDDDKGGEDDDEEEEAKEDDDGENEVTEQTGQTGQSEQTGQTEWITI